MLAFARVGSPFDPAVATAGYPVHETFLVPMTDGTLLSTEAWFPQDGRDPWPVILCRTPYDASTANLSGLAALGYVGICQDIRGFHASGGTFWFFKDDGWGPANQDGLDTVQWILAQPWCDGKVATQGGSALGITQDLLAGALPPGLTCQYVLVAAADGYTQLAYPGGALRQRDIVTWLTTQGYPQLVDSLDVHRVKDAWWSWLDVPSRHGLVNVPTYQVAGWYDLMLAGGITTFTGLQYGGGAGALGNQKLVVGPWVHGGVGSPQAGQLTYPGATLDAAEALAGTPEQWWEYWQRGAPNGVMDLPPVAYYMMGDSSIPGPWNEWRTTAGWPPPSAPTALYFHADGTLDTFPPMHGDPPLTYTYDPLDPVPTLGGANLIPPQGPVDMDSLQAARADILTFTTPPLEQAIEIAGPVHVTLYASSDRFDTDFTAMLTDVYPDGAPGSPAMLVCDGILRTRYRNSFAAPEPLVPGQVYELDIEVGETAIAFAPGHRIRIAISSSNSPRFDANPNTGVFSGPDGAPLVATNTVHVDAVFPSHVVLPITNDPVVGVAIGPSPPAETPFTLRGAAPNPFARATLVRYELFRPASPGLELFDVRGRRVRALLPSAPQAPGAYTVAWDGRDDHGHPVAPGVYFLRLASGTRSTATRLVRTR